MVTPTNGAARRPQGPSQALKIGSVVLGPFSLVAGVYAAATRTAPSWSAVALVDIGVVLLAITVMTLRAGRQERPFRAWAERQDPGSPPSRMSPQPVWILGIHLLLSVGLVASGIPGIIVAEPPVGFVVLAVGLALVQGAIAVFMHVASRAMARMVTAVRSMDDPGPTDLR